MMHHAPPIVLAGNCHFVCANTLVHLEPLLASLPMPLRAVSTLFRCVCMPHPGTAPRRSCLGVACAHGCAYVQRPMVEEAARQATDDHGHSFRFVCAANTALSN
jgi:hypothetical protein